MSGAKKRERAVLDAAISWAKAAEATDALIDGRDEALFAPPYDELKRAEAAASAAFHGAVAELRAAKGAIEAS